MRRIVVVISLAVFLLAWAALDDITTGIEPGHRLEWAMLGLALLWFLGITVLRRGKDDP